jgi:hypothetical protein
MRYIYENYYVENKYFSEIDVSNFLTKNKRKRGLFLISSTRKMQVIEIQ